MMEHCLLTKVTYQKCILVLFLWCVLLFFSWTATSSYTPFDFHFPSPQEDYYNLLSDAFLQGQLSLLVEPPPALLELSDPYDPGSSGLYRLHDASLFNGKYYLYWGPVPAILLYIPFRFLGMGLLPDSLAAVLFAFGGVVFTTLLLTFLRNRYFPNTPFSIFFLSLVAVSLCTALPFILRRVEIYEVAITGGYFFLSGAMFFLLTGIFDPGKYQHAKLILGSLFLGFAVGTRYPLFFAALILPVVWFLMVREGNMSLTERLIRSWRTIIDLLVPFLACIFLLGFYNYLRFGSWFEFGVKYVLAGVNVHAISNFFTLQNLARGLYFYFLHPYSVNGTFPFFHLVPVIPAYLSPASNYYLEPVAGVFTFLPIVFLLFSLPFLYRRISAFNKEVLIVLTSMVSIGFINALFDSSFLGATIRYELDFLPLFVLAASILILYLTEISRKASSALYHLFVLFVLVAVLWGAAFNIGIGFTGYGNTFRNHNPWLYYAVARGFYPGLHLDPQKNGPVIMRITFPSGQTLQGTEEPIVVTSQANRWDILFVRYEADDHIAFGFEQWGTPPVYSKRIRIVPGVEYNLTVNMCSLYQSFGTIELYPPSLKESFIQLNDESLLQVNIPCWTSDSENMTIGVNNIGGTTTGRRFSGIITDVHRGKIM